MTTYRKTFFLKMWFNYHLNPFFIYKQKLGLRLANTVIFLVTRDNYDKLLEVFQFWDIYLNYDVDSETFSIDWTWYYG